MKRRRDSPDTESSLNKPETSTPTETTQPRLRIKITSGAPGMRHPMLSGVHVCDQLTLMCNSDYFKTALCGRWSIDTTLGLQLPIRTDTMQLVLRFLHRTNETNITDEKWVEREAHDLYDVYAAADFLLIDRLLHACQRLLTANLSGMTVFKVWEASAPRDYQLCSKAINYAVQNFDHIVSHNTSEFKGISSAMLEELLQHETLNSRSGAAEMKAVNLWLAHSRRERLKYVQRLYMLCRYPSPVTGQWLTKTWIPMSTFRSRMLVAPNHHLTPEPSTSTAIVPHQSASFDWTNPRMGVAGLMQPMPRLPNSILMAVGGWWIGEPTEVVECYDVRQQQWSRLNRIGRPIGGEDTEPTLYGPRAYHGMAQVDHCVYIFGGYDGHTQFNSNYCFDLNGQRWVEKGPMYEKRCYVSCAKVGPYIYAVGGFTGTTRVNTCERYSPSSNQWIKCAPMSTIRSDGHAAVADGSQRLYAVGGFDGHSCFNTVEYYEPTVDTWTTLNRNMISKRSGVGAASLGGSIYAVGGYDGVRRLQTMERFDDRDQAGWKLVQSMESPRSNFGIETFEDKIYVAGGFNGHTTIAECECYDPRKGWIQMGVAPMEVKRSALFLLRVDRPPNIRALLPDPQLASSPSVSHSISHIFNPTDN